MKKLGILGFLLAITLTACVYYDANEFKTIVTEEQFGNWTFTETETYKLLDGRWVLYKVETLDFNNERGNGIRGIMLPFDGTMRGYTACNHCEEFDGLLITCDTFEAGVILLYDDEGLWWENPAFAHIVGEPMGGLIHFPFGQFMPESARLGVSYALDLVWATYFSHMERTVTTHGAEITENRNRIMGFEMPTHFFEGEDSTLYYVRQTHRDLEFPHHGFDHSHVIRYFHHYYGTIIHIFVCDETGEIRGVSQ